MEGTIVDTVFDLFEEVPYTFLEVSRGGVYGNRIVNTTGASGVFKLRNETVQTNNQELAQSAATLHIHPNEAFAAVDMVGQGVRVDGIDYEIVGQTGGRNFDTGELEHYTLTLQRTDFAVVPEES
jgi:hypothetical protein